MKRIMRSGREFLVLMMLTGLLVVVLYPVGSMNCTRLILSIPSSFDRSGFQPTIIGVDRTPLEVEYFHDVNVTALVQNATNIAQVALHFRINAGSWQIQGMTNASSNMFWGIIPRQVWRSHVKYYINATDLGGLVTIDDNETQYYSYRVVDTVPPRIQIFRPRPGEHFVGMVTYDMDFSDPGSDVDYHELYLNGESEGHGYSNGFTAKKFLPDGAYTLLVYVDDCAGNRAEAQVRFSVENPPVIPVIVLEIAAIGSVIVICLVVGALLFRKEH